MQDRWVSYIYRYQEKKRWENAGYIKVIRTSRTDKEEARIDIGLKLCKPLMCRCRVYMIYGERELILLDELLVRPEEKDVISLKKTLPWKDFLKPNLTPKDYDGMFFAVDDGDSLMSLWNDKEIDISELSVGDTSSKIGLIPLPEYLKMEEKDGGANPDKPEKSSLSEKLDKPEKSSEPERSSEPEKIDAKDLVEQLMAESVKLPLFIDSPLVEGVKLVPQDIGRLPMGNWKLGQNSFLTHGYYRYKYIMLGKLKLENRYAYVIGVPGVYTNKEKYLANMFGFTVFVPVKNADTKTGKFGYWVWEVTKQ